jgi:hypothetical protein
LSYLKTDLEESLEQLPDKVASSLLKWRKATLERERIEAILYLQYKAGVEKRTQDEIKALVRQDGGRYQSVLDEAVAESEHTRLNERLMCAKKEASMRTAF